LEILVKKIAKVLLAGTLLLGAVVPALPSISENVYASSQTAAKKSKKYVSGHVIFYKNKTAISNKFDLPGNQPIYYTFDEIFANPKNAVYRFELVRADGKVVAHIKGTAHTKKEKISNKLLAKKVKKGKYFLRFFSETNKTSVSIKYRVHN
jgi:hypothetical protein